MDKRVNKSFDQPLEVQATVTTVEGLSLRKESLTLTLENLSSNALSFSTNKLFSIGQHLVLEVCLCSPSNQIFGQVIWSQETLEGNTYGFKIVSADEEYYRYMNKYKNIIENEDIEEKALVGGRQ